MLKHLYMRVSVRFPLSDTGGKGNHSVRRVIPEIPSLITLIGPLPLNSRLYAFHQAGRGQIPQGGIQQSVTPPAQTDTYRSTAISPLSVGVIMLQLCWG